MQISREILNALPKSPDNTRKHDYKEQDYGTHSSIARNSSQKSFSRNEVREGVEKSLASPAAVKSNRECSKV